MAISTFKVFLMKKTGTGSSATYEKMVDIKDYPDLGGDPEMIETTTRSDKMQTYILGIQSNDGLTFSANYDKPTFNTLKGYEGSTASYAVWFGGTESGGVVTPTGSDGKFSFDGQLSVHVTGGGVNEAVGMNITIAPSTPITFDTGT